ncbi:hypothetical protein ACVBEQ_26345 [Nakamurella sp. GG22]
MPEQKRIVGRGFKQRFNLMQAAEPTNETMQLEAAWSTDSDPDALDRLLSGLGEAYVVDGRVRWDAPNGLAPVFTDYLQSSVRELNGRLDAGILAIDGAGNIVPRTSF